MQQKTYTPEEKVKYYEDMYKQLAGTAKFLQDNYDCVTTRQVISDKMAWILQRIAKINAQRLDPDYQDWSSKLSEQIAEAKAKKA